MNKTKLIFLLLFFVQYSFGQSKSRTIKLDELPNVSIESFYVNEVIDKRHVKSNIGFVQVGLDDRMVPAVFEKKFSNYLQEVIDKIFYNKKGEELVLIIHLFTISEKNLLVGEEGKFEYDFEFARRIDDQLFLVGRSAGEITELGLDVTLDHPYRVGLGIVKGFEEFNQSSWQDKGEVQVENVQVVGYDYSIARKVGLYSSFNELAQNKPFQVSNYKLLKREEYNVKYAIAPNYGESFAKTVIFVSDGEHIYMHSSLFNQESYFTKSLIVGKLIYFEDRFTDQKAKRYFGYLGGSLLSSLNRGIVLDTETGLIHLLDDARAMKYLEKYPEVGEAYKRSSRDKEDIRNAILTINQNK